MDIEPYNHIRTGRPAVYEQKRGLITVWGKEAVQFLDGLITNDVKKLVDGAQMLAAFPNAQGRLLAVVRVLKQGDRFLFETEEATREKVFQNLFRFTFAGDFFVEDSSDQYSYFELFNMRERPVSAGCIAFAREGSLGYFLPIEGDGIADKNAINISDELYETLRIENGVLEFGVDMDEATIVPELGLDDMISYNKGCYIGQEIIARIHFRGHVAKRLTGLMSKPGTIATGFPSGTELTTLEGKNAGRITSVTYSPKLDRTIALGYVRYDHLAEGTKLVANGENVEVKNLPFVN